MRGNAAGVFRPLPLGCAVPRIIGDAALLSAFSPLEGYSSAALAVSGGPDSMALMHLASRWLSLKGRGPASISVLTVDHGLRPESAAEAAFVGARAGALGFTHATLAWTGEKPKTGIQAGAREARYGLMTAYCREHGIACLVTAHTEDDQAETFLMRLRRGSGLDGLASMAAVSSAAAWPLSGLSSASPKPGSPPTFEASPFPLSATPATATPLSSACGCATP